MLITVTPHLWLNIDNGHRAVAVVRQVSVLAIGRDGDGGWTQTNGHCRSSSLAGSSTDRRHRPIDNRASASRRSRRSHTLSNNSGFFKTEVP
jgi:hypothetical protein